VFTLTFFKNLDLIALWFLIAVLRGRDFCWKDKYTYWLTCRRRTRLHRQCFLASKSRPWIFPETWLWTQEFTLAKQVLCCLSHSSRTFCCGYFGDGVSWTICLVWPQTSILPILAFQIFRITDMGHRCPARPLNFMLNHLLVQKNSLCFWLSLRYYVIIQKIICFFDWLIDWLIVVLRYSRSSTR
jgi:hypothetical protein